MNLEKKMCECLLEFYDHDTAIMEYDISNRLFLLFLQINSSNCHFVLVKLVSDEPSKYYGFDPDVSYYPVQLATCCKSDYDFIRDIYDRLVSIRHYPFS